MDPYLVASQCLENKYMSSESEQSAFVGFTIHNFFLYYLNGAQYTHNSCQKADIMDMCNDQADYPSAMAFLP